MNAASIDFAGEIQHVAQALGRALTNVNVTVLNETLRSLATVEPETHAITIEGEPIGAYLNRAVGAFPKAAVATEIPLDPDRMVKVTIGGSTGYRRASDPMLRISAAFDEHHAVAMRRELATWPNPWATGRENRTRQQIILKFNPTLAAQLKAKAKS